MRDNSMRWQGKLAVVSAAVIAGVANQPLRAQGIGQYFAPQDQIVAIRAGHLFDSRSGNIQTNQVVLITGDRITEVGSANAVQLPAGTRILDLSSATVLPGMIDTHVHVNTGGNTLAQRALRALANAQIDLDAGFTTVLDMDSRGSFYTVDLRDAINSGIVQGPRMQVVGQSINQRATNYYPDSQSVRYYDAFTEGKNVNSPWLARAAVREAKLHGVDYIKIYTTQDFAGTVHMWKPDGTLVNSPSLTFEEVEAIVDEAHRLGLKVACHTYGGEGLMSCLTAGVDAPNHLLELDDAGVKILLQKKLPFVPTVDDLISLEQADLRDTGGRNSRLTTSSRTGGQEGGCRGGSDCVWERRHVRAHTARKTGRPIQILREMGHESRTGIADGLSSRCTDAELRLGEPDRRDRKRQVCGHRRGLRKSHCGRDRNGTS